MPQPLQLVASVAFLCWLSFFQYGVSAQTSKTQEEIYRLYGDEAGYILFHLQRYFYNRTELENHLKYMRDSGQLYKLCQYVTKDPCKRPYNETDTLETLTVVAYLNTECCSGPLVHGGWADWSSWTSCSLQCGGGSQTRYRNCSNPRPSGEGDYCSGGSITTQGCNTQPCSTPVNGGWTEWGSWTSCNVTCGGGSQTRYRECTNPVPSGGGSYCSGDNSNTQQCNTQSCTTPVNGGWTDWGSWTSCSVMCGGGSQTRYRQCTNPVPSGGGSNCSGDNSNTQQCNTQSCTTPVNGGWTEWGSWTSCSVTCGGGSETRYRNCSNPMPSGGGDYCSGDYQNTQQCITQSCTTPVNGGWTDWGSWFSCSVTCGGGSQTKYRQCINPMPSGGGDYCSGDYQNTQQCNTQGCIQPINGNWGQWGSWSSCNVSCGGGTQTRSRTCDSPPPANGGSGCAGVSSESLTCNSQACPIDGQWSTWNAWSSCSASCGAGFRTRDRYCSNPPPSNGGANCPGSSSESQSCSVSTCVQPINGNWGQWGSWSSCNVSCGGGTQTRSRACDSPPPANGGSYCAGVSSESLTCNSQACQARNCGAYRPVDGRIVGGQDAGEGEHIWLCMLSFEKSIQCSANILDSYHVVTAGHCLDDKTTGNRLNSNNFEVVCGQYRRTMSPLEEGAQLISVASGIRHPDYNSRYLLNDIAILRLSVALVFNDKVGPICLPTSSDTLCLKALVAGWGSLSYTGSTPTFLQEVQLDTYNNTECERVFQDSTPYDIRNYLSPAVVCAANGTSGGKDTCRGDSGSGLICLANNSNYVLLGITSSGFGCANPGQPGFYTSVPSFTNWIAESMNTLTAEANP